MNRKPIQYIVLIFVLGATLASCTRTMIGDINADPGSFKNREVTVAGEVVQSVGAAVGSFSRGVYEISDGTGNLWVYSETRGVPSKGAHVGVKGHIAQSLTIMGRNYGTVLQESDRRIEKPAR
jgi:hypothetical protein